MEMLIAFLLGVVSSVLAAAILMRYQNSKLTKRFSNLTGRYIQCDLEGKPLEGVELWTEIVAADQGLLKVKGTDHGGLEWSSEILMNERFPGFGSGHYHYLATTKSDWGLHTIQVVDGGETILVQVQNISGQNNKIFTLLWKKQRPAMSSA